MVIKQADVGSGIIRTISHDFKEPLRSVRWYLEKLKISNQLTYPSSYLVSELDDLVQLIQRDFQKIYKDYRNEKINLPSFRSVIRTKLRRNMDFLSASWARLYPHVQSFKFSDPIFEEYPQINISNLDETVRRINRRYEGLVRYLDLQTDPVRKPLSIHNEIIKVGEDLKAIISISQADLDVRGVVTSKFDQTLIALIFQNLIVNSIKYRHKNRSPHIEVRMGVVELARIMDLLPTGPDSERLSEDEEYVGVVAYSDNGRGIAVDHAEVAFRPFFQVNPTDASGGSGMGLAIVKSAVELQGGLVWLKSTLGVGTTFFLILPVEESHSSRGIHAIEIRSWLQGSGGIV